MQWLPYSLEQLPVVLIWLIGIVLAVRRRRKHPQVSRFAVIALAIFFMISVINTALTVWRSQEGLTSDFQTTLALTKYLLLGVTLAGWLLLIGAIFGWRGNPESPAQANQDVAREQDTRLPPVVAVPVVKALLLGALGGALLLGLLRCLAPFFLDVFGTTASMILFGTAWGAVVGTALALTQGAMRGAIAGAVAGLAVVLIWSTAVEPAMAARLLVEGPFAGIGGGAIIGASVGWARRRQANR